MDFDLLIKMSYFKKQNLSIRDKCKQKSHVDVRMRYPWLEKSTCEKYLETV